MHILGFESKIENHVFQMKKNLLLGCELCQNCPIYPSEFDRKGNDKYLFKNLNVYVTP